MNEKLLSLLDGYEECYPLNLEEQYPRVMHRITELWNSREIDAYFTDLMIDNRGGTRQGFPHKVASEIFALSMAHANIRDKKKIAAGGNPWEGVEGSKRAAVEQQGYADSPGVSCSRPKRATATPFCCSSRAARISIHAMSTAGHC